MSRNGTPQYRAAPHYLAYNPAENAILLCSVRIALTSVSVLTLFPLTQNTTNPDNAYYELFAVPKKSDPSNPECESGGVWW